MRRQTRSFRAILLRASALPLAGVILLSSVASYLVARSFANEAFDAALFDSARGLAQSVRTEDGEVDVQLRPAARTLLEYDPVDQVFFSVVALPAGNLLAGNAEVPMPTNVEAPAWSAPAGATVSDVTIGGLRARAATIVVRDAGQRPVARVAYAETLRKRDALLRRLLAAVLAPQLLIAAAAALLFAAWLGRATEPLERLAAELMARRPDDLRPFGAPRSARELRLVAVAVNRLMRRLERASDAQQAFIGNVAHQLRTPLAGIGAQAERLALETERERVQAAVERMRAAAQRAARLVGQLLTLARAQPAGHAALASSPVDLAALARAVCGERVPDAMRHDVDLGFDGTEAPCVVSGNEVLLGELLGNLIDNAVRHGRRPGTVTVSVAGDPPTLAVEDDGDGIPEALRAAVFERFVHLSADGSGSGLGLAIVRDIARLHRAQVTLGTGRSGRGTRVAVSFPAAPDGPTVPAPPGAPTPRTSFRFR